MQHKYTVVKFASFNLSPRNAVYLRGYLGNLFKEKSPLLHNHLEDGSFRYKYPVVQYKIIEGNPLLVGLNEGADILNEIFLSIKVLIINGNRYHFDLKYLENSVFKIDFSPQPLLYRFFTPWMALNQHNINRYSQSSLEVQKHMLDSILVGNILSMMKGLGQHIDRDIIVDVRHREAIAHFKNQLMRVFWGTFKSNIRLPDFVGVGKAVSRGFGTIKMVENGALY
ncbi:CRISPR-associated endonuclease Cas6 [Caldisericum sp.]|uniref:CRISPR-associated endonuclease Cas6 n=1 Tax=Caldisericum sp. TaxID=2499687 RepID=UPI003D0E567B